MKSSTYYFDMKTKIWADFQKRTFSLINIYESLKKCRNLKIDEDLTN